jgi:hypothetical protein
MSKRPLFMSATTYSPTHFRAQYMYRKNKNPFQNKQTATSWIDGLGLPMSENSVLGRGGGRRSENDNGGGTGICTGIDHRYRQGLHLSNCKV